MRDNHPVPYLDVDCRPRSEALRPACDARDEASAFQTILFPPGLEALRREVREIPACFVDLNLDQIVASVVAKRDEDVLRPIFYAPYRSEEIVRYRQAVFADLEQPETFRVFPEFSSTMRAVHADLDDAEKISSQCHRNTVIQRAITAYCDGVAALLNALRPLALRSPGLRSLRAYLASYVSTGPFAQLARQTRDINESLSRVTYAMLFHGDRVTVRKYASEPDYTLTILERFARFRDTDVPLPPQPRPVDDRSLNHIEEGILDFVGRLFPEQFGCLNNHIKRNATFIDEVVARLDREIGFFIAYLEFIAPLKSLGMPFCHPEVSVSSKDTRVDGGFDLALATKLSHDNRTVVRNDLHLSGTERMIVVSGPNQGGKTTFARMFGQLHFLAGLGCPVPGHAARLMLPDRIFTHFEREEDITNLRGKLEDELVRLRRSCEAMTSDSVVVLNEVFNSTSLDDQIFLSTKILERILATDAIGVCVTFIDALSQLSEKTISMVSTVDPDDPARRTFEVIRKPADGLAYALSLAEKHGVTYERLRRRIRP